MDSSGADHHGNPCRDCGFDWDTGLEDARSVIAATPGRYRALLAGHDGSERHPSLGWSAAGYVCHVTDNLRIWAERLVDAGGKIVEYDANALARARRYDAVALESALWSLESAARDWLAATFVAENAVAGSSVIHHETGGTRTVTEVARGNAHDATHHAWDIERSLPFAGGPRPHRVLITGGARSGKSVEAERRLADEPHVTYVATSFPRPQDADWAERVALHVQRRPSHWTTIETVDLVPLLGDPTAVLLIDCATLWLGAHLESPSYAADVEQLVTAWRTAVCHVVLVTNEVGSSIHPETPLGRRFADELGGLNARLAEAAEEVWLVVAGQPWRLKG